MTMPIIFAGTPENAAKTLRQLVANGVEVALVITREDAEVGRKRLLTPSAVATAAEELNLRVLKANRIDPETEKVISATGAQMALVVAFGSLLKQSTLDLLDLGWFNLHYSVLPRWRGASPVQSALLAGDETTGVTLFKLDQGMDTGPIVGVLETNIEPTENAQRLLERLTNLGVSLALQELPAIQSGIVLPREQTQDGTIAPKYTREDSRITSQSSAREAEAKVRAFNPEPVAWVVHNGNSLRLLEARISRVPLERGLMQAATDGALFGFGEASLLVIELQPAGKNRMSAADFLRGVPVNERTFE